MLSMEHRVVGEVVVGVDVVGLAVGFLVGFLVFGGSVGFVGQVVLLSAQQGILSSQVRQCATPNPKYSSQSLSLSHLRITESG